MNTVCQAPTVISIENLFANPMKIVILHNVSSYNWPLPNQHDRHFILAQANREPVRPA